MLLLLRSSTLASSLLMIALSGCSSSGSDGDTSAGGGATDNGMSAGDGTADASADGGSSAGDGQNQIEPRLVTVISEQDQTETLRDTQTGLVWVNDIRFCFAGVTDPEANNCAGLNDATIAGANNWRTPTTEEMSELTLAVVADEDVELNYINASCAVMTASDGWVFTENSSSPGTVSTMAPGNAGLRCVYAESEAAQ